MVSLQSPYFFSTIIPFKEETRFLELASDNGLFASRITRVKGNLDSDVKRSLLEFSFQEVETKTNELTIEIERHQYTAEYKDLTKDFYLKM